MFHAPSDNITYRRKFGTSLPTKKEPCFPELQSTNTIEPWANCKIASNIKSAIYDGTTSWLDYKSHFEACAKLGGWDETGKELYLSVVLRGGVQGLFGDLSKGRQSNYKKLVSALNGRFAPPDQIDLYPTLLRERRKHPNLCLSLDNI